ncbi:uncharacterized protein LOC116779162 [Danaus plexippus]|uniref:uncharacterized protein LOC116779162 n=1 Tax=Danaus plexippus TaxID=13037 RepID=UPI002AB09018|nr:uncharacterized protein LOC116779162 [Danaus plexippus]
MDLEEEFKDVNVEDPTSMDKVLILLESIQAEDDEFMEILLSKQNDMIITWEQPWYQKGSCLTRPLKITDDSLPKFRTDSICKDESDEIHQNWRRFRKLFNVPNKPVCIARWRNKTKCKRPNTPAEYVRRFVIAFLAQGLERNLYQVYKHVVVRYGNKVKGNYSKHEEKVMNICLFHNPKSTVPYLSAVFGREPRGIYKRMLQLYQGKPPKKKLKWTLSLASKFVNLLLEYTGEPLENLKYKSIEKSVWLKLEQDMGQLYIYLQYFWAVTLHSQIFVKFDVELQTLRRHLYKKLKLYPYKVWTDIRWKEMLKHVPDGFTHNFLHNVCRKLARSYEGYLNVPLEELIQYALNKPCTKRRLKTLALNEHSVLEVIRPSFRSQKN